MSPARAAAIIILMAFAGCGADGEPVQPSLNAAVAIAGGGGDVRGGIGLNQGPVSVFFGF